MAKKKNITAIDITSYYMSYVLENGSRPKSVYSFAKKYNFEESLFYNYFGTFDALEKNIFVTFYDNTFKALHKSEDYTSFNARNKLLSFYYTFFENLTANRSYVVYVLGDNKNNLKSINLLSGLKKSFASFIEGLDIQTMDIKQKQLQNFQHKTIKNSAWLQLLLTMRFWLDDSSPSFEKTDIFIEKSVNTSFDLLDTTPIKSLLDLGKFLYKEQVNSN
jgi:hypothetical protein